MICRDISLDATRRIALRSILSCCNFLIQILIAASRIHVNMVQHAKKLMEVLDMFVNVQLVTKDRFVTVRLLFICLIIQACVCKMFIDSRLVFKTNSF